MIALGFGLSFAQTAAGQGIIHGLKLAAVAVREGFVFSLNDICVFTDFFEIKYKNQLLQKNQ